MHPVGLYLAIRERHGERGWIGDDDRPVKFARVDAAPIAEPEPASRISRLSAIVRRRVMRTANA